MYMTTIHEQNFTDATSRQNKFSNPISHLITASLRIKLFIKQSKSTHSKFYAGVFADIPTPENPQQLTSSNAQCPPVVR